VSEWECLARRTEANPFLWPGWIGAWWSAFGVGQLQIFTVYENGRLAAILPLRWSRGVLSSITNSEAQLFGFLAANERALEHLSHALFLQRAHRIDLSFLASNDAGVSLARVTAEAASYRVFTESIQAAPYVAIDGKTWDAYEGGLRRKFRSEILRRRRRLEENGRLTLEVCDSTDGLDELLEEGFRVEASGWKDTYGTSIQARPSVRRFYNDVAQWATERGWLRLAFLRFDGRAIAFDYCLEHNKTHYLLKTGYDPAYRKYAPGMIIRYLMLARAFSEGLTTYDFLGLAADSGAYAWKREWTSTQQERLFLHMFAPTALGFLDRAVFVGGRSASKHAKNLARSSVFPERGRRVLKHGNFLWNSMLDRRRTR
jgi:CelD/BcsL family acetyltransferase involved in cellulose biosynthesis